MLKENTEDSMDYHAHIYWKNAEERSRAMRFREWLENEGCIMGRVWDEPIGPHTMPMYQVIYNTDKKGRIESFLQANRETMSILLHEAINDDLRDHTDGARWLGEELPLKLYIFNDE